MNRMTFTATLVALIVAPSTVFAIVPDYIITDLGTLGGLESAAYAINESGQISGGSEYLPDGIWPNVVEGSVHGFLYSGGVMQGLQTLNGINTYAGKLNNLGQVVGEATFPGFTSGHAFIYGGGIFTDLGTLNGDISFASDINDLGAVTGSASTLNNENFRAFLYQNGGMADLGALPGGAGSQGFGINNLGQVVGWSDAPVAPNAIANHAFLYSGGVMIDIAPPNSGWSSAFDINDSGKIVGWANVDDNSRQAALLWTNGVAQDLGNLGGDLAAAEAINGLDDVVGIAWLPGNIDQRAFLWRNGVMKDLNTFVLSQPGWVLTWASDINNAGQIVGAGTINGVMHAYLLTPVAVPEPNALMIYVGAVVTALPLTSRRRSRTC